MTRPQRADDLRRAGDFAGFEERARRPGVVPVVKQMACSVRVGYPKTLSVAEVAVDVFPAVVDDSPVGEDAGMSFKERAVTNLNHVGTVCVHRVQVAHDMAVAHAVFRLARGRENNLAVGQIVRVNIRQVLAEGNLPNGLVR